MYKCLSGAVFSRQEVFCVRSRQPALQCRNFEQRSRVSDVVATRSLWQISTQ